MKQFFKNAITSTVDWVKGMGSRIKTGVVAVCCHPFACRCLRSVAG